MPRKRNPHQKIMRASDAGRGLTLTPQEVQVLAMDDAISTRANFHTEKCESEDNAWNCACMEGAEGSSQ